MKKILHLFTFSHIIDMPCPTHPNIVCWSVQIMMLFIIPISVLLRPFTVLRVPVSKISSFCSSPKARQKCSYQHKQHVKITCLYSKNLYAFKMRWGGKRSELSSSNHPIAEHDLNLWSNVVWLPMFSYIHNVIFFLKKLKKKKNLLLHSGDTYAIIQCTIVHAYYNQWQITN